uniref:Uncharacterized protein n=1 Tax=Physcomitrium patens TaxID=3218 RepID=A0A2K1JW14_PHYPA|nr:hypothetical protein PHYPA_015484 [Physcomitrium patens]
MQSRLGCNLLTVHTVVIVGSCSRSCSLLTSIKGVGCKSTPLNHHSRITITIKHSERSLESHSALMTVTSLFNLATGLRQISTCIVPDSDVGGKYFVSGGWAEMCRAHQAWMSERC